MIQVATVVNGAEHVTVRYRREGEKTKTNGMFAQLLFGVPRTSPINNGGRRRFNHDGEHIAESQVELAQIVATMQVGLRHHFFDRKNVRGRTKLYRRCPATPACPEYASQAFIVDCADVQLHVPDVNALWHLKPAADVTERNIQLLMRTQC